MSLLNRLRNRRSRQNLSGPPAAAPAAPTAARPAAAQPPRIMKKSADAAPVNPRDRLQDNYDETARCVQSRQAGYQKYKRAAEEDYQRLKDLDMVDPFILARAKSMLEAEENFEKDLIQVGREMQAPARNWLRQRHGIQAGLMSQARSEDGVPYNLPRDVCTLIADKNNKTAAWDLPLQPSFRAAKNLSRHNRASQPTSVRLNVATTSQAATTSRQASFDR